ncbi:transglycosylase SLT domain-containing protein [Paeniroseomonas aquatica]|uniref:Transglycosylase SLT domain-containing protein n=1 Tax=Paeniroseomonas aquatica TaxID=373043 RepID=A0ABT8AH02_9PROT|nr:transglycosylase SLT domain-containing protein [Paeniroseomonas aquatica]MDN3568813.1 transglycosylase SLT domain-containing protein [Paeniroseomonas aquatica]
MAWLVPSLALASPAPSRPPSPGETCLAAIQTSERQQRLPPQLLRSIAVVESGRPDAATGRILPWPWAINVAGTGYFFASSQDAVAAVRDFQAKGVRSIDVGCAQVNLLHHPTAFASLESAFDPAVNADYAARFLKALHGGTGNWPLAAAAYHSKVMERGLAYARRVLAVWPHAGRYGQLPATVTAAAATPAAPSTDYSMYTPEFAARLRRMDEDRGRHGGAGNVIELAWATRLPGLRLAPPP